LKVRFQAIISFRKIDENSHNAMPFILCAFLLTKNKPTTTTSILTENDFSEKFNMLYNIKVS